MRTRTFLSWIITGFVGCFIFAASSTAGDVPKNSNSMDAASTKTQMQKDSEIIAILITVNKNEITAAKEALRKTATPAIKQYARMLKKEHTQNLNDTLKLSKKINLPPIVSATVISLKKEGSKELITLTSLKGKKFEEAYINAMIKGHTDVLQMFDDNLLKDVSNSSLKSHLQATRPHIESHLQQAQAIQKGFK